MRRAMLSLGFILPVLVSSAAGGGLRGARAKPVARSVDCSRSPHEPAAMRGITAAHNAIRGRALAAGGAPLARLEWSCELGNVAQAYADDLAAEGCSLVHSGNRFGENLYWASGFEPTPARVVSGWASEAACTQAVTLEHAACAPVENLCSVCGHYTQIVWRSTRRVGCGAASCGEERVWVCNYDPPGNVYPR